MALLVTPAIVLAAVRYGETSKIVRLATRDAGVQSAIAKGALRPRSRFGAALQLLSEGHAHLLTKEHRELHILTGFDLGRVHLGLSATVPRYAAASALAEVMLRFAPADAHPESFALLSAALGALEVAPEPDVGALGLRLLWQLVSTLGFAPSIDACVRDGTPIPPGPLAFNAREGGALCAACAAHDGATHLPAESRADLVALLTGEAPLPRLDARHAAAHRRLLARYIRYHLGEGAELPALDFWLRQPWEAA